MGVAGYDEAETTLELHAKDKINQRLLRETPTVSLSNTKRKYTSGLHDYVNEYAGKSSVMTHKFLPQIYGM